VKRLAILGSTGSIGQSALAVVSAHPTRLAVVALAAGDNAERLAEQTRTFAPLIVGMGTPQAAERFRSAVGSLSPDIVTGEDGLIAVATHRDVDIVICASSGTTALRAVLAAIDAGKTIALANKEVLVMAGELVMAAARRTGAMILPVDSEHNAIHQCLHARPLDEVRRLILTASGGPFRGWTDEDLQRVDPVLALKHPTWQMGRKITIDSATLMNKGLEVIEARWLFGVEADRIDVLVHPQSIVHSMVEFRDGSVIAQLGVTDMRLPIQYACSYPDRWGGALPRLDLAKAGRLDFLEPAHDRFPCLGLAYRALREGGTAPVVLNAANEVAVASFLDGRLAFTAIPMVIERTLNAHQAESVLTLELIRQVDTWAREYAGALQLMG
jgi:1-deoxy-D-xylulose-5-phosphate reductoisomerase